MFSFTPGERAPEQVWMLWRGGRYLAYAGGRTAAFQLIARRSTDGAIPASTLKINVSITYCLTSKWILVAIFFGII